jgi:NAD(P)-dependent dehydrogenase (short-subunit alcohol dehydrogenase family)
MRRLQGKASIVTGAAAGIGLAISRRFVEEGARVVAVDVAPNDDLDRLAGGQLAVVKADVAQEGEAQRIVAAACEHFNGLDVLVNCAGIGRPAPLCDVSLQDFDDVLGVNLVGPFLLMKYGIPLMIERGGGSIVNIGSVQSMVAQPKCAAYASSKGGILMLSRAAAVDYGAQGIRANTICPGTIQTPRLAKLSSDDVARLRELHPLGRLGEADEVAALAVFLASDESSFCTGGAYTVDAGRTAT